MAAVPFRDQPSDALGFPGLAAPRSILCFFPGIYCWLFRLLVALRITAMFLRRLDNARVASNIKTGIVALHRSSKCYVLLEVCVIRPTTLQAKNLEIDDSSANVCFGSHFNFY